MKPPFQVTWSSRGPTAANKNGLRQLARRHSSAGFLSPLDHRDLRTLQQTLDGRRRIMKQYCLVGIGGSALPAKALISFFNGWSSPNPNLWVLDTIDPETLASHPALHNGALSSTIFHVVSKSGATLEVDLLRRMIESRLRAASPKNWQRQFLVTTTRGSKNPLEAWARRHQITVLPLDAQTGGRFSTFTPVAYAAGHLLGLDLRRLSEGARWSNDHCRTAFTYAEALSRELQRGRDLAGIFLYAERLDGLGDLLMQLLAESLGKKGRGLTPIKFSGTRDQHSLLQLYLDGPKNKTVTLIGFKRRLQDPMSRAYWAAQEGVARSLKLRHVPSWTIRLNSDDEFTYGALVQFFHWATVALGFLLDVNPFDQPMVELQKRITSKLLKAYAGS